MMKNNHFDTHRMILKGLTHIDIISGRGFFHRLNILKII